MYDIKGEPACDPGSGGLAPSNPGKSAILGDVECIVSSVVVDSLLLTSIAFVGSASACTDAGGCASRLRKSITSPLFGICTGGLAYSLTGVLRCESVDICLDQLSILLCLERLLLLLKLASRVPDTRLEFLKPIKTV